MATMRELNIEDLVSIGNGEFSRVIEFTHNDPDLYTTQMRIRLTSGSKLRVSKGHYVNANGALVAARTISRGDLIGLENGVGVESYVESVNGLGLFNPRTVGGVIVVDGFVTSCYTEASEVNMAHALLVSWIAECWRAYGTFSMTELR